MLRNLTSKAKPNQQWLVMKFSHEEVGEKKSTADRETLEPGKVEEKKPAKKTAKKTGSTAKKTTPKKKAAKEEEK
ncbi:MAG: hypothetical protein CM15mP14_0300 [Rhodospirillaceae bacterium]|nr:MAG: hypothetical protein CM15mP14_0300 [Rhodospirillaceae bacterium]